MFVLAAVMLAVVWRRGGVLGHRSHRKFHMRLVGRTSDLAFHPEGYYPPVTYGCPEGEDGKLREEVCRWFRWVQRGGVVVVSVMIFAGAARGQAVTAVAVAGAELASAAVVARYWWWRVRWDRLCARQASPLASVLAYPFRLRVADIVDEMTVDAEGRVTRVMVPTSFKSTVKAVGEVTEMIQSQIPGVDVRWHLTEKPPFMELRERVFLPRPVLWADWVHEIRKERVSE